MRQDFYIGDSLVQPQLNIVQSRGKSTRVKPRSMAVLVHLAQAKGEVVPKKELMDAVWGQSVVTEDVLTQSIVELRKAFDDSAGEPKIIETIRRVGFRLLQPVTAAGSSPRKASFFGALVRRKVLTLAVAVMVLVGGAIAYVLNVHLAEAPVEHTAPSVAVLPFVNLSDEQDTDYFSDGLSEEILNTLARIPGLRVPARTSSFAFRGRDEDIRVIGNSLNVATVLEGSVRRSGQQIRVAAQLVDASTGYQIWTETYDYELADVFAVQTSIANSIVDALSVQLGQERRPRSLAGTANSDAYQLFLLGRHHLDNRLGDWLSDARKAFNLAIEVDPLFARAYCGLADTYLIYSETPAALSRADSTPFEEALELAGQAIDKALKLDPELADAYFSRAAVAAARSELAAEEEDLRKAISLNPSLVRAWLELGVNLIAQHRPAEAHGAYRKAISLDPLNPQAAARMASLTAALGDYDSAVSYPIRLLDGGLRSPLTFEALVDINRAYGRFDERVRWGRELVRVAPTRAGGLAELADAYLELGEFDLAEHWARRVEDISPMQAVKVRSRLYAARDDVVGIARLAQSALQYDPPKEGVRLTPAQSSVQGIVGISYVMNGQYDQAISAFERVRSESPTLNRRSPELPLFALNWLILSHFRAGNDEAAAELLQTASSMAQHTLNQGYGKYPPFLWELSLMRGLSGRDEEAMQLWQDAVAMGWRHYFLQGRDHYPPRQALGDNAAFDEVMRKVQTDLAAMRQTVRNNGWAESPDEFFARDQITISGAR